MDILVEEHQGGLWVAALEKGRLEGLEVDPGHEQVRWGSIYYAKVTRIDAALDAAFLDLDGENRGLIYNKDLRFGDDQGHYRKGGDQAIGKVLSPGAMIVVQAKTAYAPALYQDEPPGEDKLPQMSMDISLPGRYLIYCPKINENLLSTRIRDKKLRKQMKKMMAELPDVERCILRVAAADMQTDMLKREAKILHETWAQISRYMEGDEPGFIMEGPDAIQRTLSDKATQLIDHIEVVTMDHFRMVEEWCTIYAPDLVTKIQPVELDNASEDLALFHYRDIIGQIESLFQSYDLLPGGGNIIIQKTAALTAIDVNKGGDKRSYTAVNIEAAHEIGRQARLRNIGGMIVVDFLKFQSKADEGKVIAALEEAFHKDPCTTQIHGKTSLGLIEITRRRRTPPLDERIDSFFV